MNLIKKILTTMIAFSYCCALYSTDVVIIGGGPCGLATAIEAFQKGMTVTVVEKEKEYLDLYWVFLSKDSLSLLNKWQVTIPEMQMVQYEGDAVGLVQIKRLNTGLKNRVKELGITRVLGKFISVDETNFTALVRTLNGDLLIPYDFIVAADGAKSSLRKRLGIGCDPVYQTMGIWAFFPYDNSGNPISSEIVDQSYYYIRRLLIPGGSVVSLQGMCYDPRFFSNYTIGQFRERLLAQGWTYEAERIRARDPKMTYENNMDIFWQKAQTFSKKESCALLVGDAAASTSFLDSIGLNIGLQTAVYAGDFFSNPFKDSSYSEFNQKMENTSKQILENNPYLFSKCAS